jgi:hypothetical protein
VLPVQHLFEVHQVQQPAKNETKEREKRTAHTHTMARGKGF